MENHIPSYEIATNESKNLIANVEKSSVSIVDVETLRRVKHITGIRNPSHVCFSPDQTKLAVKNTSGRISVYNLASQDCISKQASRKVGEGNRMFYAKTDTIISSDWEGKLYLYDICTQETSIQHCFNDLSSPELVPLESKGEFVLYGDSSVQKTEDEFLASTDLYLIAYDGSVSVQFLTKVDHELSSAGYARFRDELFLYSEFEEAIYCYNITSGNLRLVHNVSEQKKVLDQGYFVDMCVSASGEKMAVAFDNHVRVYHTDSWELLSMYDGKYISNIVFLADGSLWIGCWEKIVVVSV